MLRSPLSKIDLSTRIKVVGASLAIVASLGAYFLVIPAVNDIDKMGNDIETQRADLEDKYVRGQNMSRLDKDLDEIQPSLAKLDYIFIDQNRALEFVTTLEGIATNHNVKQKINLLFDRSKKEFAYKKIPLEITIDGNYQDFLRYLASLESLNNYINISSINILKDAYTQNPTGNGNISAQIIATTYWK